MSKVGFPDSSYDPYLKITKYMNLEPTETQQIIQWMLKKQLFILLKVVNN